MKVTATSNYKKAIFTWDESLTNCEVSAMGTEDSELKTLINDKVNEGAEAEGWEVKITW